MNRGGLPIRTVGVLLCFIVTVYLLYLYNATLGRLRDAELSAERYRREEETKVAQLQDVLKGKDELQEKCDIEKREFTNRLNSLNQQHKMLKSQYDEHEVEQMRLEQEAKRRKEEFDQVESQRNQEYQQLKQQKDLEISSLKDQLANIQRQNQQLQDQISNLRTEVQDKQQQLVDRNSQLQQLQQQQQPQQQLPNQESKYSLKFIDQQQQQGLGMQQGFQQQQQQQPLPVQQGFQQQQQALPMQQGGQKDIYNFMGAGNKAGLHEGQGQSLGAGFNPQGGVLNDLLNLKHQQQQQELVDQHNEQHQVKPPANPQQDAADTHDANQVGGHAAVQQKMQKDEEHQVLPPDFNINAQPGSKEAGGNRQAKEAPAPGSKLVDDQQHEDPLELKQMAPPNLRGDNHVEAKEDGVVQMLAPRGIGRRAGDEEEEEDQYKDEKYDDNNDKDNKEHNNNNVQINNRDHGDYR